MIKAGLIVSIVGIAVIIIAFPTILSGADNILRDTQTDTVTDVTQAAGSGTMSLSQPLYGDSVTYVTTVTSTLTGTDTPVASTFNGTTDILTVTGLGAAPATRTLTCVYQFDQTVNYTGLGTVVEIAPLIIWVSALIGIGAGALFGYRHLKGRAKGG